MKILELFAGTRSIGKAFEAKGHEVFSVEWDKDFENIDLYADINTITAEDILQKFGRPDVIWASPDCATFSIAAISHHRRRNPETGNLDPVSDYAKFCDEVDQHVLQLIRELNPRFYFIENPRGGMRKMTWMQGLPRYTVTYCQYEMEKPVNERRMKPTDIWSNHPNPEFKPMCKNGDSCHAKAPRGSRTGTQGLKGSKERSVIPADLCQHIVDICEKYINPEKEKEMELRVEKLTLPEVIKFNFEELRDEITERSSSYKNLVYSEDQMKQAKTDCAMLRKFTKALSDERIRVKKEVLKPYEDFEAKISELSGIVNEAINNIDSQVKAADEKRKAEKLEKIRELFKNAVFPEWVTLEMVMDAKWLYSSVSMTTISKELIARLEQIEKDLATLSGMPEFAFEALDTYKTSLNLGMAVNKAHELSEQAKRKAEYEAEQARLKAEAEARKQEEMKIHALAPAEPPVEEVPTELLREWLGFKAFLTVQDAQALAALFATRGIQYEQIEV